MRAASSALIALLNSQAEFCVADCLTIAPVGGAVVRLTSADHDVTVGGVTFVASGPRFSRAQTKLTVGLPVDTMAVTLYPGAADLLGGLPWPAAVAAGQLDGARVTLERVFAADWADTSAGSLILFVGRVGEAEVRRTEIDLPVHSDLELLNQPMPRNLYQPGCLHTLFDSGCGLARAAFSETLAAGVGSTAGVIQSASLAAAGVYNLGVLTCTSGANAGVTRSVRTFGAGAFTLTAALPAVPAAGDTFTASQGCDKTQATCSGQFANLARFRGYPFIPRNEQAQ